ncbi:hypothetical protein K3495_g8948 [Podosphaera aphanis]|nr:hypothetical protein K3495_g8948 [Podosphaera aphanis]
MEQDFALQDYLKNLISIGKQATKKHILIAGREIFKGGKDGLSTLIPRWAGRWLKHYSNMFKTIRGKPLSFGRRASHECRQIELHFEEFQNAIIGFDVCPSDVYNMDETGFRIACLQDRIVLALASQKSGHLSDPDHRDYITSIETICADGTSIPPSIIQKGSVLHEKSFLNDLDDDTVMAATTTGYINDELGLQWLRHFDLMTKRRNLGDWRLLMMDGQSSHINEHFLLYCWTQNIIPYLLPSHFTHILQANDVCIFQHLQHWYQEHIAATIQYGVVSYNKVDFLNGYQRMRRQTFKKTILHAWENVGLFKKENLAATANLGANDTPSTSTSWQKLLFQDPLTTVTRATHSKDPNQRLDDHINYDIPLMPSFQRSLHAYTQGLESKAIASKLYKKREQDEAEAAKEASSPRIGHSLLPLSSPEWVEDARTYCSGILRSSRRLQVGGIKYKGQDTRDIEWLNSHLEKSRKTKNTAQALKEEALRKEIKIAMGRESSRNTAKGNKDIAMHAWKEMLLLTHTLTQNSKRLPIQGLSSASRHAKLRI